GDAEDSAPPARIRLRYWTEHECDLVLRAGDRQHEYDLGPLPVSTREWVTHEVAYDGSLMSVGAPVPDVRGSYGTGDVVVTGARFLDGDNAERDVLEHGRPARLELVYEVINPRL